MIDMKKKIVGRVASRIASLLQGKHKPSYVQYLDCGDYVVVINAKELILTGNKLKAKMYTRYSGYPGGLKKISAQTVLKKDPSQIIRHAVSGMLPKNKLRDKRLARLFVFADSNHPYEEQLKNHKVQPYRKGENKQ